MSPETEVSEADRIRLLAARLTKLVEEIVDVLNIAADGVEGEQDENNGR